MEGGSGVEPERLRVGVAGLDLEMAAHAVDHVLAATRAAPRDLLIDIYRMHCLRGAATAGELAVELGIPRVAAEVRSAWPRPQYAPLLL